MLGALLVIAISLARLVPAPLWLGWFILAFILVFDSAYAWSWWVMHPLWFLVMQICRICTDARQRITGTLASAHRGPLGWLYPFEIQPLETRPAGGKGSSLQQNTCACGDGAVFLL